MQVCMKTGHGIKHFFNNNTKYEQKSSIDFRYHRTGRFVPGRVPDRKRIRSTWYPKTFFFIQHCTYRTSVSGRMGTGYEAEPTGEPALGGYDGQ